MDLTAANHNHIHFFHKDLFRVYKLQRFLIAETALVILSAFLTPLFEKGHAGAEITTVGDALWWTLVTVTSTGYGDFVPVTFMGRLIGTVLMFSGFALFSVVVGIFIMFVNRHQSRRNWQKTQLHLEEINRKLDRLEKQQEFLIKSQTNKR